MNFDSDRWLRVFGIALLVLVVGYFLIRVTTMFWRNLNTVQKAYDVSALAGSGKAPPPWAASDNRV